LPTTSRGRRGIAPRLSTLGKGKRANRSVKIMTLLAGVVSAAVFVTALTRNHRRCESGSAKADDNRTPPS
jgi:hypothetical protein